MSEELKTNDNDSEINKINVTEVSEQFVTNNGEGTSINNEKLMKDFDEYFKNNITNEERNELNSINIDNIKELKSDEINKLPFILNKDQFYQSFVLFQKYLYWNIQRNYFHNLEKSNNNIYQNQQNATIINYQKSNNENLKNKNDTKIPLDENKEKKNNFSLNDKASENKIKSDKNFSEILTNKNNCQINNYDERPIKTSHKNFLELLENSIRKKNREFFVQIFQKKIRIIKAKKLLKKKPSNSIDYSIQKNDKKSINKINKYYSYDNILLKKYKKNIFDCIQTQKSIKKEGTQEFKNNMNTNVNVDNNAKEINSTNKIFNNDNQENKNITENDNKKIEKKENENPIPSLTKTMINETKIVYDSNKKELNSKANNNNSKIANKQHLIQQKIKELNDEIYNFKEERNKIQKLKEEYEKLQSKLIEDIQEFNDKKEEFEKYRQNEMNKIKQDKIKYTTGNRNINDIKLNYHNMVLCSEKDKEIIKNLKNQINELKNIIKAKPPNSTSKKNIFSKSKKYKINNNRSDIDGKNKEEEKGKNEIYILENNKKDNIFQNYNKFETISDDLKEREKNYSSFGSKNNKKRKSNCKKNEKRIKKKLNENGKNIYNDMVDLENIKIFNKSIKSANNDENSNKKIKIINTIENVKTENNFINLNINTNALENNGFYFRTNKALNNNNSNNSTSKNSNCKLANNKYGISKYSSYFEEGKKYNNIIINNNNRKNKFKNLEKVIERKSIFKNNQNSNINSLFNNRKQIQKFGTNNANNNKLMSKFKTTKNLKTKPMINRSPYKKCAFSRDKNNKERLNNRDRHQNLSNKKYKTNFKLSLSNSSSTKNKNKNKFMETKRKISSISNQKKYSAKKNLIKNGHKLNKLNKYNTNSFSEKKIFKNKNKIHPKDGYDFIIPEKYLNIDYKLIRSLTSKGKIIKLYTHNKKEIIYKSGVIKETFQDGFQIIYFTNGDKKQIYPDGKMVYYFHESRTVQTKFSDGLYIFKFSNGQIEKHFPDKTKRIYFPDGSERFIKSEGNEESQHHDGTILTIDKSGIIKSKANE